MKTKICIYDNGVGADIPVKIDTFPVEMLLGKSIKDIHKAAQDCQLFCVFTHIQDNDFIVPTEEDKRILKNILDFGKKNYLIDVKDRSIWYNENSAKNIIISDSVKINSNELEVILNAYLNNIFFRSKKNNRKQVEMYIVVKIRSSEEVMRTPNIDEAIKICDKTPCSAVLNRAEEIVYRTRFGKVAVPTTTSIHTAKFKASYLKSDEFKIKIN